MNIRDAYPQRVKPVNVLPTTPARDDNAPIIIVGGVTEVRGSLFMLNDDPVGNWFRASNEAELKLVTEALMSKLTIRVTVEGKVVKGIQI